MRVIDDLSGRVDGACNEFHRELGPGLLESAYEECLCWELERRAIPFVRQQALPVVYKGERLDCGYIMNVVIENTIMLELKAVEALLPIHGAQLISYLKLAQLPIGLLLNFNVAKLTDGVKGRVNNYQG